MIRIVIFALGVTASSALAAAFARPARTCESLKSLTLTDATIILAEWVPTGPFQPPDGQAPAPAGRSGLVAPPVELPAHCRIALVLTPSTASHIESEVWLPDMDWNGKYEEVGQRRF